MRLTRGATCEQCASLECGVCEARPRHSIAPSARRPRHSVASSGTTFLDNCAYADFCATRWRRVHDDRATQWRRVVRTCTAQLRGRRGGRYQTTARRPRTSGLPARRSQRLPTAPPQPMILGRTGGHICYDGVAKRAIGSGVEHFLHTEGVAGSNPASPTRQVHEVSDSLTSFLRCE